MKTIDALRRTLPTFAAEYIRGSARHAALASLTTPDAVLQALALSSSVSNDARSAMTLALVTEHQRAAHPLWQAILLVAYEPMLANVWRRLRDRRDAEQRILLAFLEAIQKVSLAHPPQALALHLRHATERGVFGTPAAARQEPEILPLVEARHERVAESLDERIEREDAERRLMGEVARLFPDDARTVLDVLVRARTGRESLERLIAERHPEMSARQRAAIYEQWQRMRRRALAHLEERFREERESTTAA